MKKKPSAFSHQPSVKKKPSAVSEEEEEEEETICREVHREERTRPLLLLKLMAES